MKKYCSKCGSRRGNRDEDATSVVHPHLEFLLRDRDAQIANLKMERDNWYAQATVYEEEAENLRSERDNLLAKQLDFNQARKDLAVAAGDLIEAQMTINGLREANENINEELAQLKVWRDRHHCGHKP